MGCRLRQGGVPGRVHTSSKISAMAKSKLGRMLVQVNSVIDVYLLKYLK